MVQFPTLLSTFFQHMAQSNTYQISMFLWPLSGTIQSAKNNMAEKIDWIVPDIPTWLLKDRCHHLFGGKIFWRKLGPVRCDNTILPRCSTKNRSSMILFDCLIPPSFLLLHPTLSIWGGMIPLFYSVDSI